MYKEKWKKILQNLFLHFLSFIVIFKSFMKGKFFILDRSPFTDLFILGLQPRG